MVQLCAAAWLGRDNWYHCCCLAMGSLLLVMCSRLLPERNHCHPSPVEDRSPQVPRNSMKHRQLKRSGAAIGRTMWRCCWVLLKAAPAP